LQRTTACVDLAISCARFIPARRMHPQPETNHAAASPARPNSEPGSQAQRAERGNPSVLPTHPPARPPSHPPPLRRAQSLSPGPVRRPPETSQQPTPQRPPLVRQHQRSSSGGGEGGAAARSQVWIGGGPQGVQYLRANRCLPRRRSLLAAGSVLGGHWTGQC
jgi:hypothetical protein